MDAVSGRADLEQASRNLEAAARLPLDELMCDLQGLLLYETCSSDSLDSPAPFSFCASSCSSSQSAAASAREVRPNTARPASVGPLSTGVYASHAGRCLLLCGDCPASNLHLSTTRLNCCPLFCRHHPVHACRIDTKCN